MSYFIDLHMHSTASDGTDSPQRLVELADIYASENSGKALVALTDHDTVSGLKEFLTEAEKYKHRVTAVGGVEFSTIYKSEDVHILGYGIDPDYEPLQQALAHYRHSRDTRNEKIVARLREQGFQITMNDIQPQNPQDSIGRPLMAKHLLKMNYVSSIKEAFDKYLGAGKPCYVDRKYPTQAEVISLIHEAGGLAVLAHPVLYKKLTSKEFEEFLASLKVLGLDGMEVYYSRNTMQDTLHFKALADSYELFYTGGSDYHGTIKPDIRMFEGTGTLRVSENVKDTFIQ